MSTECNGTMYAGNMCMATSKLHSGAGRVSGQTRVMPTFTALDKADIDVRESMRTMADLPTRHTFTKATAQKKSAAAQEEVSEAMRW